MTRRATTIPRDYFAKMYEGDPDPWRFASSDYERDKYAATLAALPRPHYASALDVGCSIGIFTRQLAARCDAVIGLDPAPVALEAARKFNEGLAHVAFRLGGVPADYPEGQFDLVVVSEVAYYLSVDDLRRFVMQVGASLHARAHVILVHWTGETDYPLTGDEAAEHFIRFAAPFCRTAGAARTDRYRLDVLERTDAAWIPEAAP